MDRIAKVKRETNEVKVDVELNIDGTGDYSIDTGIPFLTICLSSYQNMDISI